MDWNPNPTIYCPYDFTSPRCCQVLRNNLFQEVVLKIKWIKTVEALRTMPSMLSHVSLYPYYYY